MTREDEIRARQQRVLDGFPAFSPTWPDADALVVDDVPYLLARVRELEEALREALNELGVPTDDYPAPVGNAVTILRAALTPAEPKP